MKYFIIIATIVCGLTSFAVVDDIQIPGCVKGFEIVLRVNPQSGLNEYYFERSYKGQYNLIPIIYNSTDKMDNACNDEPFDIIHSCMIHSSSWSRLAYVKYHKPKDGNTHGIYIVCLTKKGECDGIKHIVSFIPDVGKTVEIVKTVYVTNTVVKVSGDVSGTSTGKYESIDFKFHN